MQSWAVSSSGAVGYWQFLKGTGAGYGLEISSQVDQRQDLEKSTDAACKYFKSAYAKFGNWTAAAASYNCGVGGYNAQAIFQQQIIITICSYRKKLTNTFFGFLHSNTF